MDIFGPTHTELRQFLKKYIQMEIEDVVDITVLRLKPITGVWTNDFFLNGNPTSNLMWHIEVACRDGLRGEQGYKNLVDVLGKYISLFGEEPHSISLSRVFIVENI